MSDMVYVDAMFGNLDPSQLVALHALLEERHVTRAAERVGLTQSSMSHRLKQLREALGDPLLVPARGELVLTPRAERIAGPLASALQALWSSVAEPPAFEPGRARLKWTIALPDLLVPLVPGLLDELGAQAPGIDLRVMNMPAELTEGLSQGHPMAAVAPTAFVGPSILARPLGRLRFGVTARKGHPLGRKPLTLERWLAYPHVVVRIDNGCTNVVSGELAKRGLERRVGLEAPSFLAGLFVVARSDHLFNVPIPLVDEVAESLALTVREAPLPLPEVPLALVWHERFHADPAHQWTRELLFRVVSRRLKRA
ncbi:LysR family transcriptional regulator [Myxococcus sp. RHSTA-1-4]|uniref:LysR family transcriptional regulator n=1 Tax=Myxococcus sp. RHSTA-1-4 TaxID=2874601 RepID=UPI001CBF52D1|nr:LysR family transcriptional regulator [Myxococcus sp. RHSTA-1-4]MBZ4423151.1 LysR family transcriptional regulator [Myxococcus sp. RHSTA-1-4]